MIKKLKFMATLACLSLSIPSFSEDLVFINDDLRTGLNRAAGEGKLIFLEFWANYCTPCKVMEEYTYKDPSVIERMKGNYIPVKVNIQSFDGFDLKNQYKVTVLPTIIILDSKGRQVARYEESMSATQLNTVLDKHNMPQNRSRFMTMSNTYYAGFNSQTNKQIIVDSPVRAFVAPSVPAPVSVRSYNNTPEQSVTTSDPVGKSASEVGEKRTIPSSGFTIQTGAYGQLSNAQQVVADMRTRAGSQKQFILQSRANGKTTYRIFIGSFATRQQADAFRRKAALEGYVRGFADFAKKKG